MDVSNSGWQHIKLISAIYRVICFKQYPSREHYVLYLLNIEHKGLVQNMLCLSSIVLSRCILPLGHISRYTCKSFTAIFSELGFQIDHPVVNTLLTEILCLVLETIGVSHFCYLVFTASKWWWHSQSTRCNSALPFNWTKEGILQGSLTDKWANLTVISLAAICLFL